MASGSSILQQLFANLYGDNVQNEIKAENPYFQFQAVPQAVTKLALSMMKPTGYDDETGDLVVPVSYGKTLPWAVGAGLLEGVLGGLGDDYQSTLTDRYVQGALGGNPSGLSGKLAGNSARANQLFRGMEALGDYENNSIMQRQMATKRQEGDNELKKLVVQKIIENPWAAEQALPMINQLFSGKSATPTTTTVTTLPIEPMRESELPAGSTASEWEPLIETQVPEAQVRKPDLSTGRGAEGAMIDQVTRDAQNLMRQGSPAAQAWTTARDINETRKKGLARQYEGISAARKSADEIDALTAQVELGLQGAGDTGYLGQTKQSVAGLLGLVDDDQRLKYSSGQEVINAANEAVKTFGRAFKGPMSDNDVKIMLRAAPSLSNEPEANQSIITRWKIASNMQKAYANFMEDAQDKGMEAREAEKEWAKIKAQNPYVIKSGGSLEFNPAWINGDAYTGASSDGSEASISASVPEIGTQPEDDSLGMTYLKGIPKAPKAIYETGKAVLSPSTYKEAVENPEKAARVIGQGAAMTAGFTTGASVGAGIGALGGPAAIITSPLGALIGGGIGAGLGYLGFNMADEAAQQVAGVSDTPDSDVLPTKEEIWQAADLSGQATGAGALGEAAGAGISKVGKIPSKVAKASEAAAETAKKEITGVTSKAIEDSLAQEAKIKYFDDAGNAVPVQDAAQYKTAIEQSLKTIEKDGFIAEATNKPEANQILFYQKMTAAGQEVKSLHALGEKALTEIYDGLSVVQKRQFPLEKNPATGRGGFTPDFSGVRSAITEMAKADPQIVKSLTQRAAQVIRNWERTNRSFRNLQTFKEAMGKAINWKGVRGKGSAAWDTIQAEFYKAFAEAQNQAFDYAMQAKYPEFVGALKNANAKFSAYSNIEPLLRKVSAKGRKSVAMPKVNNLGLNTVGSLWERSPKTRLFTAEKAGVAASSLDNLFSGIGQGASSLEGLFGAAPLATENGQKKKVTVSNSANIKTGAKTMPVNLKVPKNVSDAIDQAAAEFHVEPDLVRAVISQESGGKANQVSEADARGYMQVLPSTAAEVAAEIGLMDYDLQDPEDNIRIGTAYLAKLLQRFKDKELALTAYHSGPGRVSGLIGGNTNAKLADILDALGPRGQEYAAKVISKITKV